MLSFGCYVVYCDDETVPPVAPDVPLKVYFDYAFARTRRASRVIAATVEAASLHMKPGSPIFILTGCLWSLAVNGYEHWIDPVVYGSRRLQLSPEWRNLVRDLGLLLLGPRDYMPQVADCEYHSAKIGKETRRHIRLASYRERMDFGHHTSKADVRAILNSLSKWGNRQARAYKAVFLCLCWFLPPLHDFDQLDGLMMETRLCATRMRKIQKFVGKDAVSRQIICRAYVRTGFLKHCINEGIPYDDNATSKSHSNRRVALVLHSGRDDGVTQACCVQLARIGNDVAILYADVGSGVCLAMAQAAHDVERCGRRAVALPKLPFWGLHIDAVNSSILTEALDALGASRGFDVIGNPFSSPPPNAASGLTIRG